MKSFLAPSFWQGKRVFLTGHSGFKGSWLTLWLHRLGAELYGYSLLEDDTQKERFRVLNPLLEQRIAGIGHLEDVTESMARFRPDVVIHLAAQPLVRLSYADPVGTFATNVMGTAHVLEAVRQCDSVRCALLVTTDKVYEDQHWPWAYRENDRLGGYDPYSASKAAVSNLTQWLATYLADVGIRVNAIAPGFFATKINRGLLFREDGGYTERSRKIISGTPVGRFGEPEELVGAMLYLCDSTASGFVTGVILPVDGGFSAYCGV